MTSGNGIGSQLFNCILIEVIKFNKLVAQHIWIGGQSLFVVLDEFPGRKY